VLTDVTKDKARRQGRLLTPLPGRDPRTHQHPGLQFTAVRPSSRRYARAIRPAA
jgi:hypothetical protein